MCMYLVVKDEQFEGSIKWNNKCLSHRLKQKVLPCLPMLLALTCCYFIFFIEIKGIVISVADTLNKNRYSFECNPLRGGGRGQPAGQGRVLTTWLWASEKQASLCSLVRTVFSKGDAFLH